jgi:hypothetical protein
MADYKVYRKKIAFFLTLRRQADDFMSTPAWHGLFVDSARQAIKLKANSEIKTS